MQVLNAQRAYNSWKKITISEQKDKILKLEATVLRMNSLVELSGDELARTDALALQPHLAHSLRNTVAACASLAKQVDQNEAEGRPLPSQLRIRQHECPSLLQEDRGVLSSPMSPMQVTIPEVPNPSGSLRSLKSPQPPPSSDTSSRPHSTTLSPVDLSSFIGQLRLACAYNAFETLSDPTVTIDSIRNKFRFLLSLMSREHLISYYKASLMARIDQSALNAWEAVPFFGLGGAGSHYARPPSPPASGISGGEKNQSQHDWPLVSDPLLAFSAQVRESLDDTWFDVRDLEAYLKEQEVCLVVRPPRTPHLEGIPPHIDVMRLLQGV